MGRVATIRVPHSDHRLLLVRFQKAIKFAFDEAAALRPSLVLLFGGAVLWLIAGLAFAGMTESPGAVAGGRNALGSAKQPGSRILSRRLIILLRRRAPCRASVSPG